MVEGSQKNMWSRMLANLVRQKYQCLGIGNNTKFWSHEWNKDTILVEKYLRLHSNSNLKMGTIFKMRKWNNNTWEW